MSGKRIEPRPPYPPLPEWKWPEPGQRTWTPPEKSFFGPCTGSLSCSGAAACPVGVIATLGGGPYGCDCSCHDGDRERATAKAAERRPAARWWLELEVPKQRGPGKPARDYP